MNKIYVFIFTLFFATTALSSGDVGAALGFLLFAVAAPLILSIPISIWIKCSKHSFNESLIATFFEAILVFTISLSVKTVLIDLIFSNGVQPYRNNPVAFLFLPEWIISTVLSLLIIKLFGNKISFISKYKISYFLISTPLFCYCTYILILYILK